MIGITFEDITKANEGLGTVPVKGKDYVVVPQRVKAFRRLFPDGFITTDILSHENGMVLMQAKAGYYDADGNQVILGTGMAFEQADSSYINKTSYIENCETSAIGRALGFIGLGIDAAICSAEELINAVNNQDKPARNAASSATVTTQATVPPVAHKEPQKPNPNPRDGEKPGAFIGRRISEMNAEFEGFDFMATRAELIKQGKVEDVPSATMKMEQAKALMDEVYAWYAKKAS